MIRRFAFLVCWAMLCLPAGGVILAQVPEELFRQNCMSCHTIGGGRLTGPDLKNVEQRKDRQWLMEFLLDPPAKIAAGDPYAQKLQQEANGIIMPKIAALDRAKTEALLDLILAESALAESKFKGVQLADRPFTAQDISQGQAIFLGSQKLANGGTACVSCHTISGSGGLGGGRLAPDLTRAYERLGGKKNLAAWLGAPATPTMQLLFMQKSFTPKEVLSLVAYLEVSAQSGKQADSVGLLYFFLLALGGTVLGLVFFDTAWRHRLRGVRKALVAVKARGTQR